jgi:tRNA nucleotidyltransferase/poly(A) polymerase
LSALSESTGYQEEGTQETGIQELRPEGVLECLFPIQNAGLLQVVKEFIDTMVRFWNNHESKDGSDQLQSPGQESTG